MNKPTANQLYKESKSKKPFKIWLSEKQQSGDLENHFNANGEEEVVKKKNKPTLKKSKGELIKWNVVSVLFVGVALYGIYTLSQGSVSESAE
jgi:hypothetical protein